MLQSQIRVLRPLNCLMAGAAVLMGVSIASEKFTPDSFLAAFVAVIICGAGNVINDYFDFEIDKINSPKKPIPSGVISRERAYLYAVALFTAGVLCSALIGVYILLLAVFNSALLYIYSWKIKRAGGIGKNFTVSYLVASPFLFGGLVAGNAFVTVLLALLAALANTAREIVKDIEDYEGDRKFAKTLPYTIGFKKSAWLAAVFVLAAVALSPLPYLTHIMSARYLVMVMFADLTFLAGILYFLRSVSIGRAGKTQNLLKLGMMFGLLAFFVGRI